MHVRLFLILLDLLKNEERFNVLFIYEIMKIVYTKHTLKRMRQRAISSSWIESCIELPDYNVTRGNLIESNKKIGSQVLKVVWER